MHSEEVIKTNGPPERRKKKFDSSFKAKVAIAAIMSGKSLTELAALYDVHPTQISQWKNQLIRRAEVVFYPDPKNRKSTY